MPLACLDRVSNMNIWDEVMCLHHAHALQVPNIAANYVAVLTNPPIAKTAIATTERKPRGYWQKIAISKCNCKTFISSDDIAEGFSKQERVGLFVALHSLMDSGAIERCGKRHRYQYRLRN